MLSGSNTISQAKLGSKTVSFIVSNLSWIILDKGFGLSNNDFVKCF